MSLLRRILAGLPWNREADGEAVCGTNAGFSGKGG
jgi:hypothetical protein